MLKLVLFYEHILNFLSWCENDKISTDLISFPETTYLKTHYQHFAVPWELGREEDFTAGVLCGIDKSS